MSTNIYLENNQKYFNLLNELIQLHPTNYKVILTSNPDRNKYGHKYDGVLNWIYDITPLLNDKFYTLATKI